MKVIRVPVRSLERSAFAEFGSIVEAGSIEDENLNRAPGHMAFLWVHRDLVYPRTPYIATSRYYYRGTRCEYLQRHPASTVVLIPMDGKPSVIMVAPDDGGQPNLAEAQAILLDGRRGIVVDPGIWLRYAYPVADQADFAYVSARVDPEEDIDRVFLEDTLDSVLEWYFDMPLGVGVEFSPGGAVLKLPVQLPEGTIMGPGGLIMRSDGGPANER
jgi:ureidoglycolate hydrolase